MKTNMICEGCGTDLLTRGIVQVRDTREDERYLFRDGTFYYYDTNIGDSEVFNEVCYECGHEINKDQSIFFNDNL